MASELSHTILPARRTIPDRELADLNAVRVDAPTLTFNPRNSRDLSDTRELGREEPVEDEAEIVDEGNNEARGTARDSSTVAIGERERCERRRRSENGVEETGARGGE